MYDLACWLPGEGALLQFMVFRCSSRLTRGLEMGSLPTAHADSTGGGKVIGPRVRHALLTQREEGALGGAEVSSSIFPFTENFEVD